MPGGPNIAYILPNIAYIVPNIAYIVPNIAYILPNHVARQLLLIVFPTPR